MDDANRMGSEETHIRHNNVDVSQGMSSEWWGIYFKESASTRRQLMLTL
jgi:hypothetical protein